MDICVPRSSMRTGVLWATCHVHDVKSDAGARWDILPHEVRHTTIRLHDVMLLFFLRMKVGVTLTKHFREKEFSKLASSCLVYMHQCLKVRQKLETALRCGKSWKSALKDRGFTFLEGLRLVYWYVDSELWPGIRTWYQGTQQTGIIGMRQHEPHNPSCPWYVQDNFARSKTWWMLPEKRQKITLNYRFVQPFLKKKLPDCGNPQIRTLNITKV
jgi:hypothetical protein